MKVMIAMPTLGSVPTKTFKSVIRLMFQQKDVEYFLQMTENSLVYDARNSMAQAAMDENCDYVLWIDSDMTFPADALERLMAHDKDVVTGLYFQRRGDHKPVIYCSIGDEGADVYTDYPKDKLFMVCGCGFGFVLMKTEVLRRITEKEHLLFHPMIGFGEDLSFCYRWLSMGGEIWCDPTIKCGHIGEYVFTEEDWQR